MKYVKKIVESPVRKVLAETASGVVMMETIVEKQRRASTVGREGGKRKRGVDDRCAKAVYHQALDTKELKNYLSLQLYAANMKVACVSEFWKDSPEHNYSFVRRLFSRDRALRLSRCFRFTDEELAKGQHDYGGIMGARHSGCGGREFGRSQG